MTLMPISKTLIFKLTAIASAAAFTSTFAYADLIPNLTSGPTPDGPNFAYTYTIDLSPGQELNPVATNGATCPGPSMTFVQCNPTGTFVTIYDIPNFISASVSAPGWFAGFGLTGTTPSTINATFDDPTLVNVTFFYTGPVLTAGGATVAFNGFQIDSSVDGTGNGNFTDQATQANGTLAGETDQGVGAVSVPTAPAATTPESATLALSGLGLVLLGWGRKLFHRR